MNPLASLTMRNNDVRNLSINPALTLAIREGVTAVYGPDYKIIVTSGGQPPGPPGTKGTFGSRRHGTGDAGEIRVYGPDGGRLSPSQLVPLAQHWLASDQGSVGLARAGDSHDLHLDLIGGSNAASIP